MRVCVRVFMCMQASGRLAHTVVVMSLSTEYCKSGYCTAKLPAGSSCWEDADCINDACGRTDSNVAKECCPSKAKVSIGGLDFCSALSTNAGCNYNGQCATGKKE